MDSTDDYVSAGFVLNSADGAFSIFAWIRGGAPGKVIISQPIGADWLIVESVGFLADTCASAKHYIRLSLRVIGGQIAQQHERNKIVERLQIRLTFVLSLILLFGVPCACHGAHRQDREPGNDNEWPQTLAERTDFRETSHYEDVLQFIEDLESKGAPLSVQV